MAGWDDPSPRLLLPLPYKDRTQTGRWQIPALSRVVRRLGRLVVGRGACKWTLPFCPGRREAMSLCGTPVLGGRDTRSLLVDVGVQWYRYLVSSA